MGHTEDEITPFTSMYHANNFIFFVGISHVQPVDEATEKTASKRKSCGWW